MALFLLRSARRSAAQRRAPGSGGESDRTRLRTGVAHGVSRFAFLSRSCISRRVARRVHRTAWIVEPDIVLRLQGDSRAVSQRSSLWTAAGFSDRLHRVADDGSWTAGWYRRVVRWLVARGR